MLIGRIGVRGYEDTADVWDEDREDFMPVEFPAGLAAPFAINLGALSMAVQPRAPHIRLGGIIGAMRELLQRVDPGWKIEAEADPMSLEQWKRTVSRVIDVRFLLRKPNPHYQDDKDLEAVMEDAQALYARLQLSSEKGLDTESSFIVQSQNHVDRRYGEARYEGIKKNTHQLSVYDTVIGAEEVAREMLVGDDGEVAQSTLAMLIRGDDGTKPTAKP